ncbi:MAG TPA: CcmD family protein [Spirochaetota bacterium]|nr:CcmD family protein [Spirochaetota bacterium]
MRPINIACCILLLLLATGAAIPVEKAGDKSATLAAGQCLHAQDMHKNTPADPREAENKPEPSTTLYHVMGVVLFIWIGIAIFLFRLDRRVARLENRIPFKK